MTPLKIKATTYNKVVGYCTPVKNHNVGKQQAEAIRKEFVVR